MKIASSKGKLIGYMDGGSEMRTEYVGYCEVESARKGSAVCQDEYIVLLPSMALSAVQDRAKRMSGQLLSVSNQALYGQLLEAGVLVPYGDSKTKQVRIGSLRDRAIRIKREALLPNESGDEEALGDSGERPSVPPSPAS